MRTDRPATPDELARIGAFGKVAAAIDTNVRAQSDKSDAFVDLVAVGSGYPLVGRVEAEGLPADTQAFDALGLRGGAYILWIPMAQ